MSRTDAAEIDLTTERIDNVGSGATSEPEQRPSVAAGANDVCRNADHTDGCGLCAALEPKHTQGAEPGQQPLLEARKAGRLASIVRECVCEVRRMSFRHGRHFELFLEQFSLYRGEKIAIVGPNGSGKTSLLRILASLERPTSCEHFFWQGKYRASEQSFGFLRQQPYIFSGTVESNLAYPLQLRGVPRAEIERAMVEILQHLNLSERRYIQARKLSGGEQKRLALGRLLILDPAIMFLDEPIAHLDYHSQHIVQRLLMRTDATLLFTTHDLRFAHLIASRILYLNQGKLVSCSMENMLTGRVEGLRLVTHSGLSIPLPRPVNAASAEVMLRPERLQLSHTPAPVDADGQSAIAQFCGRITAISDHRDAVWLEIDCGELIFVRLSPEQYRELDLNLYREIFVCCDANSVELIS